MANPATYAIDTPEKSPDYLEQLPVEAATKLYVGTLAAVNAAGNVVAASDAASIVVAGIIQPNIDGFSGDTDNSAGAAGAQQVTLKRGRAFVFDNSTADPVVAADILKTVYVEDNQTVNHSGGTHTIAAGKFLGFENGDAARCIVFIG